MVPFKKKLSNTDKNISDYTFCTSFRNSKMNLNSEVSDALSFSHQPLPSSYQRLLNISFP